MVGRLRGLMLDGESAITGDTLRLLSDALRAARAVLDAKRDCRFHGAEVDLMVARELRQVSEAAQRAAANLRQALEVMQG